MIRSIMLRISYVTRYDDFEHNYEWMGQVND